MTSETESTDDAPFEFADEFAEPAAAANAWKILIVDDEEDVHSVTRLLLNDLEFEGRPIEAVSAYSGRQARTVLAEQPDIAVAFIDVVMETEYAGLELVRHIRTELNNRFLRIILRTGQPGYAPEKEVSTVYEINDYKTKAELTDSRFLTSFFTALRSYRDMIGIEESRRRAEVAEAASNAKSEFLAMMSHEIRTPMNGVAGMAQLLLNTEQTREQANFTNNILNASNALLNIVNDVLDFSRLEADKLELRHSEFNLHQLIVDIFDLMEPLTRDRPVELVIDVTDEVPINAGGDPGRLRQIIVNLLGNAIKFTKEGDVTLRVRPESSGTYSFSLRFSIIDSGPGIPEAEQEKLFRHYEQTDATAADHTPGTGLGLVISKRLCELMGGSMGVKSAPGRGSEFWFTVSFTPPGLPTGEAPADADSTVEDADGPVDIGRVLVVEDNVINQQVTGGILRSLGIEYDIAATGAEALEKLDTDNYGLILMDCLMPVMDGFEATRRIRAGDVDPDIRIIALTASALPSEQDACLEAGMNGVLLKPINIAEMRRVLLGRSP